MDILASLKIFLLTHKPMAGPILGVIAFGESLILVGLFFPATAIMLFAGGLIQKGVLDPVSVIGWSIAGAVVGDALTYWIGRWVGPSVVHTRFLSRHKPAVAQAKLFFRKYGFLSIFIGRFLGPVRSTIPLVAGIMKMSHGMFQVANVTSAIAWVPAMLLPGYIFARSVGDFGDLSARQWAVIIGVILALTAISTLIGVRLGGRSGKSRRARGKRAAPPPVTAEQGTPLT